MARVTPIQLYRRIGGAAGAPGTLLEGEPGYNDNGDTLDIGGATGATVHRLVGPDRQIELTGPQTVTTGAGNAKTWDVTNFKLLGGAAGNVLSRGAANGDVAWAAAPPTAVLVNAPITGNGLTGTELGLRIDTSMRLTGTAPNEALGVLPATYALATDQIPVGTDNVNAVTSAGLRSITGNVGSLTTSIGAGATSLTAAIDLVHTQVTALSAAMVWVGTFDGTTLTAVPPATTGALPAPAAGNRGWTVMVTAAIPTGTAPVPPGPIAQGDWLVSPGSGTTWTHIPLFHAVEVASNIGFTPIVGPPAIVATNVQAAIAELNTRSATALTTIHVDGTSITGVTGSAGAGLTAGNALKVGTIDGGTF